jgi:hypothetical protein
MDRLFVEATKMTPEIILDSNANVYSIKGNSRPENPMVFYKQVFDWLESHFESNSSKTNFIVQMDYFNTSTSKVLLDLFEYFEKKSEEKDIHVIWQYQSGDEEMMEAAEELFNLVEISFELKEV